MAPLLADLDIQVIFFLVAAVIALINRLYEKSKELRAKAVQEQKRRESTQQIDLVREGTEVVLTPAPEAKKPKPVAVRPPRPPADRPPRRTTRRRQPVVRRRTPPVPTSDAASPIYTRLRNNPGALKEAIILREILGPPVSMRGQWRPGVPR